MKNQGIEKLFEFRNIYIYLDFGRLFEYNGLKHERYNQERKLGNFLISISIILLLIVFGILILQGTFYFADFIKPKSILHLIPYLLIVSLIIGYFLKRDRNSLELNHKKQKLTKIFASANKKEKGFYINDFLDIESSMLLNQLYNKDSTYIKYLFSSLIKDSRFSNILSKRLGLNADQLNEFVNKTTFLTFSEDYVNFFSRLLNEGILLNTSGINLYVIFFTLLKYYLRPGLIENKVTDLELDGLRKWYSNSNQKFEYQKKWKILSQLKPIGDVNTTYTSTITPTLDKYGQDLTSQAANRSFSISIGKEELMTNLLSLLERDTSTFVYLLGESGVGKTTFIKYLATRMVVEDVPSKLKDSRLVVLNFAKIIANAQSIEDIKKIFLAIFQEVSASGEILLIGENFTSLFSFRSNLKDEAVNLLKNLLDNKIKFIAIDEPLNYQKYIKSDLDLASKFDVLEIKEPDPQIALQIMADEALSKESKNQISIQFSALKRIVDYAYKFDYEKKMPLKGMDLLEEAMVLAKSKGFNYLDGSLVEELLYTKLGVKIGNLGIDEKKVLGNLEDNLKSRVVGQTEAITPVVAAIKRSRSGLTNSKKPIASFLFYGPTGVGKTELAKALADLYYGSENLMIRIDMSEYQEEQNLTRLIGGYNSDGSYTKGFLADTVRSRPFALVLLDEIEKANPKVLDLFLSVLDDGFFKDGMGRKIDFYNTIIIMTSNVGSKEIQKLYQQKESYSEIKSSSLEILSNYFRPEFLNRFDKLIMFKHLSLLEITKIVEKFLAEVNTKLSEKGIVIHWNDKTLEELAKIGYSPLWGARELRRVVQERIEDILANEIILGNVKDGDDVFLNGLSIQEVK